MYKSEHRLGKEQLFDARLLCKPLTKSLGKKRDEITPECPIWAWRVSSPCGMVVDLI